MNFFDFDPIKSHGIDVGPARRNPTIVPIRFRDMILPENYDRFRWQFFRVHFQFVMANEVRPRLRVLHDRVRPGAVAGAHGAA